MARNSPRSPRVTNSRLCPIELMFGTQTKRSEPRLLELNIRKLSALTYLCQSFIGIVICHKFCLSFFFKAEIMASECS